MCGGITVHWQTVPRKLAEQYGLLPVSVGTEERVLRFLFRDPVPRLPAYVRKEIGIFPWGNRNDKESILPRTGWCKVESLEAGTWKRFHPEPVWIPATMGVEKGVWFPIEKGIRGIVVEDEEKAPHVYMLTQEASPEFLAMTKHERMPMLIE